MSNIRSKDVPSYIEFTPCSSFAMDCEADIELDPPSASKKATGDDASSFSEEFLEVIEPRIHDMMSHSGEVTQQDFGTLFHDTMQVYHMMSHSDDVSQQDLDAMDLMVVHDTMRPQDWFHLDRNIIPASVENDDMKVASTIKQHDLDVSASDLQQMILDIRSSSPLTFVNQCTLSLSTAIKLVANDGAVNAHSSPEVNETPMSSYNVSQPSAVFMRQVSQTQSMYSSLRPGAATTLSSTIPLGLYHNTLRHLMTNCPTTPSYCQECYDPCSRPPLVMYSKPNKRVEDIHGFDIRKFGPMPLKGVLPRAA